MTLQDHVLDFAMSNIGSEARGVVNELSAESALPRLAIDSGVKMSSSSTAPPTQLDSH